MEQDLSVPAIAIDGVSGAGKGTAAKIVAERLDFHLLDSGAVYRSVALLSLWDSVPVEDEVALGKLAREADLKMNNDKFILRGVDVTTDIRTTEINQLVPFVSKIAGVRAAVGNLISVMRRFPGLVADGRDMWKVFPTPHMFYIYATEEERASRRVKQMERMKLPTDYNEVLASIVKRDRDDMTRAESPLECHPDALYIDNTNLNV